MLSGQPVICSVQDSRACPLPSSAVWRVCAIDSNLNVLSGALPTLHQCSPLYTRPKPAERMPFSHLPHSFCPHSLAQALPLLGKPHCPLQIPPPLQTPPQFRQTSESSIEFSRFPKILNQEWRGGEGPGDQQVSNYGPASFSLGVSRGPREWT